ncbi:hypothetical protein PR048_021850 [Dryococelus australis]|uniref:Uncharacterized protein n=1 Tax=Dryococelus australis TaxID=614101 RepID=A0ABQ9GZC4_9NEOP|nr:hypothetical protein PR048_021850 [Dryococelus australis]
MASSGTIPTCENPVTRQGIEPWWEASRAYKCILSKALNSAHFTANGLWFDSWRRRSRIFACGIREGHATGRRVFSVISRFPLAPDSALLHYSPRFTFIVSQDLGLEPHKFSLFTHSPKYFELARWIKRSVMKGYNHHRRDDDVFVLRQRVRALLIHGLQFVAARYKSARLCVVHTSVVLTECVFKVLCILEPKLNVHWLLPHTWQLWDSQGVSLQVCYWPRGIQGCLINGDPITKGSDGFVAINADIPEEERRDRALWRRLVGEAMDRLRSIFHRRNDMSPLKVRWRHAALQEHCCTPFQSPGVVAMSLLHRVPDNRWEHGLCRRQLVPYYRCIAKTLIMPESHSPDQHSTTRPKTQPRHISIVSTSRMYNQGGSVLFGFFINSLQMVATGSALRSETAMLLARYETWWYGTCREKKPLSKYQTWYAIWPYKAGNAMTGATLARIQAAMADLAQAFTTASRLKHCTPCAYRSDEAQGVHVSVTRIAPSLLDLGRAVPCGHARHRHDRFVTQLLPCRERNDETSRGQFYSGEYCDCSVARRYMLVAAKGLLAEPPGGLRSAGNRLRQCSPERRDRVSTRPATAASREAGNWSNLYTVRVLSLSRLLCCKPFSLLDVEGTPADNKLSCPPAGIARNPRGIPARAGESVPKSSPPVSERDGNPIRMNRGMEQRRNARVGETGDPRVNPPTSDVDRHTIPTCENPAATQPGIEPTSPLYGCSVGSPPDFRMWKSRRTTRLVCGFSRGSPVSPRSCHCGETPYSPRLTRIGSQDLDVKESPKSLHSSSHATVFAIEHRVRRSPPAMSVIRILTIKRCSDAGRRRGRPCCHLFSCKEALNEMLKTNEIRWNSDLAATPSNFRHLDQVARNWVTRRRRFGVRAHQSKHCSSLAVDGAALRRRTAESSVRHKNGCQSSTNTALNQRLDEILNDMLLLERQYTILFGEFAPVAWSTNLRMACNQSCRIVKLFTIWAALNIDVLRVEEGESKLRSSAGINGRWETPEKTR